jgi:hypothetical protein
MSKNFSGRDYLLYLSTAAPGDAAITTDYVSAAKLTTVSISGSRNAIDKSSKDDGDDSTFIAGRRNLTVSGSCIFDHTIDAGQGKLTTGFAAADGLVYFLVSTGVAAEEEYHGSGILTSQNRTFADESTSTLDFTIQVSGALTVVAADSTT